VAQRCTPTSPNPPSYNSALIQKNFLRPHRKRRTSHPPILRMIDCMAEFVVDPGNDGRIKIILPTGIDLDPGARGAGDDPRRDDRPGEGIWRSNDSGASPARS